MLYESALMTKQEREWEGREWAETSCCICRGERGEEGQERETCRQEHPLVGPMGGVRERTTLDMSLDRDTPLLINPIN